VTSSDTKFVRVLIFVNGLIPLSLLLWDWYRHRLGANPIEFLTRTTGVLTLLFVLLTLAITPARKLTSVQWLGKHRRMLGLFAFFYGSLHLVTYVWFDKFFGISAIVVDVAKRPFIAVGMASFLLMVPLAVTSTNKMIKRLGGKRWNRLHKLTYLVAVGGVIHYWMIVKSDIRIPLYFATVATLLLVFRLVAKYKPELISRTPYQSPIPRR
jgi:sulfoxide reductase heme-binding subunit YedZ